MRKLLSSTTTILGLVAVAGLVAAKLGSTRLIDNMSIHFTTPAGTAVAGSTTDERSS
jgi:hypothetical protein